MLKTLSTILMMFTATASFAQADVAANRQLVLNMMENVFAARNPDAVSRYFTENYIQRNPLLPSGSAAIEAFLSRQVDPDAPVSPPTDLHRIFGEGDLVATHSTYYNFGPNPMVAFDVYRIEDGRIAEHWDNLTPLRPEPNPADRTQVDGAREITDLDQTEANRTLVLDLIEQMFINGERIDITQYINPTLYLQHNPDAGDGLQGLQTLMAQNAANGKAMQYQDVGIVLAEGNFVLTGAEGTLGEQPTAFYDLWRLEDGLIVEHWDVIAPIPTENLPDGYPGKF